MVILKLAFRNLVGAGLRTWLNVVVLSFTYVLIIWHQGLFSGMYQQASRDVIKDEIGGGQYWVETYDPFDPFTLEESHALIPDALADLIRDKRATSILIRQGTIYPQGRVQPTLIKGIEPHQTILDIPTTALNRDDVGLSAMVGKIMAAKNGLGVGDTLTLRWRDVHGTFDAAEAEIVAIMQTNVPTMDLGQVWIPLDHLRTMSHLESQATMVVVDQKPFAHANLSGWHFKNHNYLLKDIQAMIKSKRAGSVILYALLLFLSLLAVFDTQVLSIFRRRKEIGTLMALGMIRAKVIALFTLEGMLHGMLGIAVAALYGLPVLLITASKGIPMPSTAEEYGYALTTRLFPIYSIGLIGLTIVIVMLTVTIVSYLPSRKISGLQPTEALKGKLA